MYVFSFCSSVCLKMHLVHFNEKYGSLREAADKPDGLAVLAIFFQVNASLPLYHSS